MNIIVRKLSWWLHKILHDFGFHWWTPFEMGRLIYSIPGMIYHKPYCTKVRHCKICGLVNEEVIPHSLPPGYYIDKRGIVTHEQATSAE